MLKIVKADKDSYITDKVIRSEPKTTSNVGAAGTLDLFKLYGLTNVNSKELSRLLVHFDLDDIKEAYLQGNLDINDSSFWCKMHLSDVYGGQTTPINFSISVFPLSASFDEGIGKDVAQYSDYDVCNWLTSSRGSTWYISGCGLPCDAQTSSGDYITSSINLITTEVIQNFKAGDEDLIVDVTSLVSATLSGEIPDRGFRLSFHNSAEDDSYTYFVKRFGSRQAYDESKRPKLIVGFDDSITDDSQNLTFDSSCNLTLYNYSGGILSNIVSGSSLTQVSGDDCLVLKMITEISGGHYDLLFSGSQFSYGQYPVTGTYQSSVTILTSDPIISSKLLQSGSVIFTPVWCSSDLSLAYVTGSNLTVRPQMRTSSQPVKNYVVSVNGLKNEYTNNEQAFVRLTIFDQSNPLIKVTRVPVELSGIVVKDTYYQIRDSVTKEVIIPFDDVRNSTKVSSDSSGMFFKFDTSSLLSGRTYVIDTMISKRIYSNTSPEFRIQ